MLSGMDRMPPVLTAGTLPPAELTAARLDGELFAVDEGWICADEPDSGDLRAAALAALLPPSGSSGRLVMMGLTAAWLHGVTDAPPWRHEVCVRSEERARLRLAPRFVLHELAMSAAEVCAVGCLRVTTPARTVFDLARRLSPTNAEWAAMEALVSAYGTSPAVVADGIRDRLPGARRAAERLRRLAAEPRMPR